MLAPEGGAQDVWACVLMTGPEAEVVTFASVTVVPTAEPAMLADVVTQLRTEHLVVAAPAALAPRTELALALAAARWPGVRVARLVTPQAPLALLTALALARTQTDHPAAGVRLAEELLRNTWSGAWLRSVSKLTRPQPSMLQHVRSLLPGGGFLVRQHPSPAVLGGVERGEEAPFFDRTLLVEDGAVPGPVAEAMSRRPRVGAVRNVTVPGDWSPVYGRAGGGQLAMVPMEPAAFIGPPVHRCGICRLELPSPICPYCRAIAPSVGTPTGGIPIVPPEFWEASA